MHALLLFALRKPHEPEFAALPHFPSNGGLFLDVGANSGQSALSFRLYNRRSPILSIEPLPCHRGDLRFLHRFLRRFDYMICAAGEEDGTATINVPVFHGMPLTGEASMFEDAARNSYWVRHERGQNGHASVDIRRLTVPVRRLDDLGLSPEVVKIDVEGSELNVLRGLMLTIERSRPVVLVERGAATERVGELLGQFGYSPYAYVPDHDALVPYSGQPVLNVVFAVEEPS